MVMIIPRQRSVDTFELPSFMPQDFATITYRYDIATSFRCWNPSYVFYFPLSWEPRICGEHEKVCTMNVDLDSVVFVMWWLMNQNSRIVRQWSYLTKHPNWRETFAMKQPRIFERTIEGGWKRCWGLKKSFMMVQAIENYWEMNKERVVFSEH